MESFDVGDKVELIDPAGQVQSKTGEPAAIVPVGTVMEIERLAMVGIQPVGWVCRWLDAKDFDHRGVFQQYALRKCNSDTAISVVG